MSEKEKGRTHGPTPQDLHKHNNKIGTRGKARNRREMALSRYQEARLLDGQVPESALVRIRLRALTDLLDAGRR